MTYLKKISFDEKEWYQIEWEDVDFSIFDPETRDCDTLEEFLEVVNNKFPNCHLKYEKVHLQNILGGGRRKRLDKSKFKKTFDSEIPQWRESLKKCMDNIREWKI